MITAVVVGLVAVMTLYTLRKVVTSPELRADYLTTLRAMRWWMIPAGVLNLSVVVAVFNGLVWLAPWSWFGWWKLLGGTGNIWVGQTGKVGLGWQIAAFAIPLCLFLALPIMAHWEEVAFRLGSEKRSTPARVRRQLRFGLMHSVYAGIPIAAGLALTLSGLYFERVYLRTLQRPAAPILSPDSWTEYVNHDAFTKTSYYDLVGRRIADIHRRDEEIGRQQRGVAVAAAAHTVSNGIAVGGLLLFLTAKGVGWL